MLAIIKRVAFKTAAAFFGNKLVPTCNWSRHLLSQKKIDLKQTQKNNHAQHTAVEAEVPLHLVRYPSAGTWNLIPVGTKK